LFKDANSTLLQDKRERGIETDREKEREKELGERETEGGERQWAEKHIVLTRYVRRRKGEDGPSTNS
jgi:hypothetical protein